LHTDRNILPLLLPGDIHRKADDFAKLQGTSLNAFINTAITEKVALMKQLGSPAAASGRGYAGLPPTAMLNQPSL
jgi:hypothetical protein